MNFRLSFLFRKLFFFYLMILCGWLASCGLRTAPRNLPEIKQKSTFSDFKVRQRGERIRLSWKINEAARKNALKNFDVNSGLKDYFLIRVHQIPLDCMACETVLRAPLRVLFSSSAIIRDGNHLYYYLELPERDLKLREYELSHFGPDEEMLSPAKTVKFGQSKLFPKVPAPSMKIIQIEDEKQTIRFSFGKVVLKKTTVNADESAKLQAQKNADVDNSKLNSQDKKQETEVRTFILRLTWPQLYDRGLKRLQGEGNYFEEQEIFQVNLYRARSVETWPETPINSKSGSNNYYLDSLKLQIRRANDRQLNDSLAESSTPELLFYVDLRGQNGDTWLYHLRLADRFGNESVASETVTVHLPKTTINGQSISK